MSERSTSGTERCSRHPFCDETSDFVVPAPDGSDYPICRDCYESDCGRCFDPIENDENVAKGLCQDCRDEIRMWGGDEERGVEKDPNNEQTKLLTDGGQPTDSIERMLVSLELRDGWCVSNRDDQSASINYHGVPADRLERQSLPGIDVYHSGNVWMLQSHDNIGDGFDRDHAGIVNHAKTVDCTHLDDAKAALINGMEKVETSVGDELRDAHKPRLFTDGGTDVDGTEQIAGFDVGETIPVRESPGDSRHFERVDEAVEAVADAEGDLCIVLRNVGASPWLRPTPYENHRGVLVRMWSCISVYPKAVPGKTLLFGHRVPVWPDESDDYNVRMFTNEWVRAELRKGTHFVVRKAEESPFCTDWYDWNWDNRERSVDPEADDAGE